MLGNGFWCYTRDSVIPERPFRLAMQGGLRTATAGRFEIVSDKSEDHQHQLHVRDGNLWADDIARHLSTTTLFFWHVSPGAFASQVCQRELDTFQANLADMAAFCPTNADATALLRKLVVPIGIHPVDEVHWNALSDENPQRAALYRHLLKPVQMDMELDFHAYASVNSEQGFGFAAFCYARIKRIRERYQEATELLGGEASLRAFLASDRTAFIRTQADHIYNRHPAPNYLPAVRVTVAHEHKVSELGLTIYYHRNADLGFGISPPLSARHISRIGLADFTPWAKDSRLTCLWTRQDARRLRQYLTHYGLDLPNQTQAAAILQMPEPVRLDLAKAGLHLRRNFWTRAGDDVRACHSGLEENLPIIAIRTVE